MKDSQSPYEFDDLVCVINQFKFRKYLSLSDAEIAMHLKRMMHGNLLRAWKLNARSFRLREARDGHLQMDLSGLVAPKPPRSEYGRCNTKENSVYYAALDIETALLECSAKEGSLYQVLEVMPKEGAQFETLMVGWLDYFRRHRSPPPLLKRLYVNWGDELNHIVKNMSPSYCTKQILFDAFIADQFRRSVSNDKEYRMTALYSSLMLESGEFEQIFYPSVANFGGWNVAIRPDLVSERLEIASIKLIRVDRDLGYGMYDCTVEGSGTLSGNQITWTCGDDYISKGGDSPFFRDTLRDPFSRLSYVRRVEKALGLLPNGAGHKSFLYVLNVHVSDYDGPIVTDEYVFSELDEQSSSALHDLLEVSDLDIRKGIATNAKYLLATDFPLNLEHVERYLQDEFGRGLGGSVRSVILSYKTKYKDWSSRFQASENHLIISNDSINEISKMKIKVS